MNQAGVSLMEHLAVLEDPRKRSNGTRHEFVEILVIAICAVLSDADTFEDIALWAHAQLDWLRRFLVLKNGAPSQETFLRVFRALAPKQFETVFRRWVGAVVGALDGALAIDGKTLRGSVDGAQRAIHRVSAFSSELGRVLGQEKVAGKSHEITAIPELLEALYIKGLLVTIDAMGCQREIAAKIVEKGGDSLLAVKGNQRKLLQALREVIAEASASDSGFERTDCSHGRVVAQVALATAAGEAIDPAQWPGCKTVGYVVSQRLVKGAPAKVEERYYISSRELSAQQLGQAVRAHWGIENRLHWMLDVCFGEDGCCVRKDNAPQNLSLPRKMVLNIVRADTSEPRKTSMRLKRKRAGWDDNVRMQMLGIKPI
jgi:predicted transposase YbfD/YdcC